MKYISQLTVEQIREIMEIYAPSHTYLEYERFERYLHVSVHDSDGCEDNYSIHDYDVQVFDWMGGGDYLERFREKMLLWFGEQYAIDYLLGY